MTSNHTLSFRKKPAPLVRLSAFVLLWLVTFGAIAGAAHSHNGEAKASKPTSEATLKFTNTDDANSSSKKAPTADECLVCQLHQHLFAGLTTASPHVTPLVTEFSYAPAKDARVLLQTYAPQRGRAPPTFLS